MSAVDYVPLAPVNPGGDADPAPKRAARAGGIKLAIVLFIGFLIVVSDAFASHVLAGFGEKALRGRTPTPWGTTLQGIFLVIFYAVASYLIDAKII